MILIWVDVHYPSNIHTDLYTQGEGVDVATDVLVNHPSYMRWDFKVLNCITYYDKRRA